MNQKLIRRSLAMLVMACVTLAGVFSHSVFAQGNHAGNTAQTPYFYLDGKRISFDDERIENIAPVQPPTSARTRAAGGSAPNVGYISGLSGEFERKPVVTMDTKRVSAQRYIAVVDGIGYEAFCGDPKLRGPEQDGAVYALSGEAAAYFMNVLKNGYPNNSEWSAEEIDVDQKMWWTYITRVAVAMANNPGNTFAGDEDVLDQARQLESGGVTANADLHPIMVSGEKDAKDTGRKISAADARSKAFEITHNRKTNFPYNPFRFEWAAGTPAGAKLIAAGAVIATAPENSDAVFGEEIASFQIEMPNSAQYDGKTAAVNLVGVHNEFSDKVWLMQNPGNPDGWQDIVFYIPEVSASAAFSFEADENAPDPVPEPAPAASGVVIQKVDALTRENIPGALVRLQGVSAATATLPDGQTISFNNTGINISQVLSAGASTVNGTVKDGVWTLGSLPYGMYMVYEERAPENYSLLPQHTAYGFFLAPPEAEVKVDMPELDVSGSAGPGSVNVTVTLGGDVNYSGSGGGDPEAGWSWSGSLTVDPPLPDFEIIETPTANSALITFENYPFGQIEVTKYDMVTEEPLAGAHIRIQGYFAEGSTNGMPIERVQVTGGNGKTVFENLPAGQYTLTEIEAPGGYELDSTQHRSVPLTWGQTASTSFYNKPKTFVEVIKTDGDDSGRLLDGAVFRLTDPTTGEIWEGMTEGGKVRLGIGDGSYGNQLEAGRLYILTEIQAPEGYVLDPSPIEVIVAANNQLNTVTVKNFKKPILTIRKYDELTNEPLSGASFRLWKTEGETWSETLVTGTDGVITWTDLDPGIYSVQEIDEPYGYFKDPARREILLEGGDHKELEFFNRPRPVLTILKRDAVTGEPLKDVLFRVERLEGETIGEFLTDENGRIELSPKTGYLLEEEIYRVREVTPPENYLLDTVSVKDVMLKWQEPTELVFENVLKPTLIFIKRNGLTGRGISDATYKVEYEGANGGIVNLGSTFKTKCGLIVIPYVQPGWYVLTETIPAPGYSLPTNPVQRMYLAPGANSYTYEQTQTDLYVDPRTNPSSGERGDCGDWCGYLCSVLCAGNCGFGVPANPDSWGESPGGGNMHSSTGGAFGNLTITNGGGEQIGTAVKPSNPGTAVKPVLSAGTAARVGNLSATVTFTSSASGKYYCSVVESGAAEPSLSTSTFGTSCAKGANTVTVYMSAGAKDLYIKVKDADGNVSDAIKIAIPAYGASTPATDTTTPNFDNVVIKGGTVVYLNPAFPGIKITFGNQ